MRAFTTAEQQILLDTARAAIQYGLTNHAPLKVNYQNYSPALQAIRAAFVTLRINGKLRGCIGSLQAHLPLIQDVAQNSFSAAFKDPRFPPLSAAEQDKLALHISILSAPEPIAFSSEQDLLSKIRPQIDGLILSVGKHRGTFLPSVWQQLPEPATFLRHLKNKAGLPQDFWSSDIKVERYTTESIE